MEDTNTEMALSPGHLFSGERVRRIPPCTKLQIYDRITRIATWNVRSLYATGKLANLEAEMQRLQINILEVSEVRWPGTGKNKNRTLYYSGNDEPSHYNVVGIPVSSGI